MQVTSPDTPLKVHIILRRDQLRWPSLRFLLDGLTGALSLGQIFAAPDIRGREGRGVALLAQLERLAMPGAPAAADAAPLPFDPGAIGECDVIVDFRARPASADLAGRARAGVWQLSCHDTAQVAGPVMQGASAFACRLTCRRGGTSGVLASAVVQTKVTVAHSQAFASEKSVQMVLRELHRLALTGGLPDLGRLQNARAYPGLARLPGYAVQVSGRAIRKLKARIPPPRPQPFALRAGPGDLLGFDPASGWDIEQPADKFRADPFLFERAGAVYCFYEEYPYDTRRGHISVARLTGNGAEVLGPALVAPHHLSFPYVFEEGGELFMMPETIQAARIELWRCVDFPLKWELHATALEGRQLGDPVLFRQGGDWWLFANSCHDSFGDFSSELSLYRVDGPELNRVVPHPLNPVVVGSDCARSAGRVFHKDGRLYRLSQDNSGDVYGYGLNLMEITELTDTGYAEHRVRHVTPDQIPGAIGCHHADAAGGMFVVDVRWP